MTVTLPTLPDDFPLTKAPGVFRIAPSRLETIASAAGQAGLDVRRIDLHAARSKTDILARIASALDFPGWFGHNWDALADCLTDLAWLPPNTARVFVFEGCSGHEEALPVLLEILQQCCDDWLERAVEITCVFVIAGNDG